MPTEPTIYIDSELVPERDAVVPITDAGFKWGYAVFDSLRTFSHEPTFIDDYLDRIERSARGMRIDPPSAETLRTAIYEAIDANTRDLDENDDLQVRVYLSGAIPWKQSNPTQRLIVAPKVIPFAEHALGFLHGKHLSTARTRQVEPQTQSPNIKSTSRLHLRLADVEVHDIDPDSEALMLDRDGNVTELTMANIFIVKEGALITPPTRNILPGITRQHVLRLANENLNIPVAERDFQLFDVYAADEVFYTATSKTIMPVTSVDNMTIGEGQPGSITMDLLDAFSDLVGIDIVDQFLDHLPDDHRREMKAD